MPLARERRASRRDVVREEDWIKTRTREETTTAISVAADAAEGRGGRRGQVERRESSSRC